MDALDKLAMQQMHDDMVALTAALKEFTEALNNRKDVIDGADPIPVEIVSVGEDAQAILSALPLTVTDGGTPVKVEVVEGGNS